MAGGKAKYKLSFPGGTISTDNERISGFLLKFSLKDPPFYSKEMRTREDKCLVRVHKGSELTAESGPPSGHLTPFKFNPVCTRCSQQVLSHSWEQCSALLMAFHWCYLLSSYFLCSLFRLLLIFFYLYFNFFFLQKAYKISINLNLMGSSDVSLI